MSEIQDAIVTRLAGDPTLTGAQPAGLAFGVFDRWLLKPPAPGATPTAFDEAGRLKRSIVTLDAGENPHPSKRPGREMEVYDVFPLLYLFAAAHTTGRAALEAADRRLRELLHGWEITLPSGERVTVESTTTRTPVREDESFSGNLRMERRFRATGARALAIAS